MLTPGGGTRLGARQADDDLGAAAREAAGARYKLLGELGRSANGGVALLARDRELDALVILLLNREAGGLLGRAGFTSTILPELTDSVPCSEVECPVCGVDLASWARLCANCWSDVSGLPASADPLCSPAELLAEARRVARGAFTIVGHLTRADGGGAVYFGRAVNSGRVSAFRLIDRRSGANDAPARTLTPIRELKLLDLPDEEKSAGEGVAAIGGRSGTPRATMRVEPTPVDGIFSIGRKGGWRPTRAQLFSGVAAAIVVIALALLAKSDRPLGGGSSPADSLMRMVNDPSSIASNVPKDSGEVLIGGAFPEGAVVTLNGMVLGNRRLVLAPGIYFLGVTAPGYAPIDYRLSVKAGDEQIWTPRMEKLEGTMAPGPTSLASTPSRVVATTSRAAAAPTTSSRASGGSCSTLYAARRWQAASQQCAREAEQGKPEAQLNVGYLYLHGRAAPQNEELAAHWFQRSAAKGNRTAQYELGVLTEEGRGVPRSNREAAELFLSAAKKGDVNAQVKIGRAYERGSGISRDRAEAATWYRQAMDNGNSLAKNYLGMLYVEGKGIPRDTVLGVSMIRSAANAGVLEAQANLGILLANGRGVARNPTQAAVWLRKAADRGHKDAAKALRDLEKAEKKKK